MSKLIVLALVAAAINCPMFAYTPAMENQGRRPDKAEATAILQAVCGSGAQVKDASDGAQGYCNPCPDFTSLHGLTTQQFNLRWVLNGSFSAPGSQDVAAFFEGCEPLAAHFGGVVLLNKAGDGWKMARYDSSVRPLAARTIRLGTGRDIVFSEGNVIGLGLDVNSLYTFDFVQQAVTSKQVVLQVADTTRSCDWDVTMASLDKVTWQEQNFSAVVTWGKIRATADQLKDCPAKIPQVPARQYTLQFTFDGTAFQLAPDSVATFNQVNQSLQNQNAAFGASTTNK